MKSWLTYSKQHIVIILTSKLSNERREKSEVFDKELTEASVSYSNR